MNMAMNPTQTRASADRSKACAGLDHLRQGVGGVRNRQADSGVGILAEHRSRRIRLDRRPLGLRQDHAVELRRRPFAVERGSRHDARERQAASHGQPRRRLHAGARRTRAMAHGARQCRTRHRGARRAGGEAPRPSARPAGKGRPQGFRGRLSEGAVAWHAPARGARRAPSRWTRRSC
jgi:hypothetical protein